MNYQKPHVLNTVPAQSLIMGDQKGMIAPDNDVTNPHLATATAYEADE
jgi:hypothetical protein